MWVTESASFSFLQLRSVRGVDGTMDRVVTRRGGRIIKLVDPRPASEIIFLIEINFTTTHSFSKLELESRGLRKISFG